MRAPTTRKGHAAELTTTTESEGQAATPQRARRWRQEGEGDPAACPGSLVRMSNYLVTHLPTDPPTHHTYLPPYFLTYLLTYSFFSSLSCFSYVLPLVTVWSFPSLPAPPPIVQQDVDARARRSLNKTLTRRHAARSTRRSCTRTIVPQTIAVHQNL